MVHVDQVENRSSILLMIDSRPDLSQKLRSYMHEFYFAGLEEKCNEANSKIQDLEIENSRVKKLNNHLQEENAGYTF